MVIVIVNNNHLPYQQQNHITISTIVINSGIQHSTVILLLPQKEVSSRHGATQLHHPVVRRMIPARIFQPRYEEQIHYHTRSF
jgi:hypothetical protein